MFLKSISIQGFKSFDEKQTLSFEGNPGLYFLTGDNQTNEALGANGSGKTTVLDAIVWNLFEKTSRGLKAANIKNWSGTEKVNVSLTLAGQSNKEFTIVRTWNPNSLKWDLRKTGEFEVCTQEELEAEIGVSFETFHQAILIPQFSEMFFDMKPTAQAKIFSDILNLDEWDTYSDRAKSKASWYQGLMHDLEADINTTKGQLLEIDVVRIQERIDQWEEENKLAIKEAKRPLISLNIDLKAAEKEVDATVPDTSKIDEQLAELNTDLAETRAEIKELKSSISGIDSNINKLNRDIAGIESDVKSTERSIKKVESLGASCNACNQGIPDSHKKSQIDELLEEITSLIKGLPDLEAELKAAKAEKIVINEEITEIEEVDITEIQEDISDLRDKKGDTTRLHEVAKDRLVSVKRSIKSINTVVDSLTSKGNPHTASKSEALDKIKLLNEHIVKYESDYKSVCADKVSSDYWVKGFKDIKLFVISEVLSQLEVEVNNSLSLLGMDEWKIVFDIARETKSGTVKKEFNILIQSPANDDLVPWQSWSGGESQRLRIAGTTGLASLILARKGINTDIEFWDEPTNGMNSEGVADLLTTLKEHAKSSKKKVWLIDHRSLNSGSFEKVVTVVKDKDGSWFDYE